MSTIPLSSIKTGDSIKLTVLDDTTQFIIGVVQAVATYDVAKSMQTDLAARHASMQAKAQNPETGNGVILKDITDDTFFILDAGGTRPTVIAFSWIKDIAYVEKGSTYLVKLINCTKKQAEQGIAILRANGIACTLDTIN